MKWIRNRLFNIYNPIDRSFGFLNNVKLDRYTANKKIVTNTNRNMCGKSFTIYDQR